MRTLLFVDEEIGGLHLRDKGNRLPELLTLLTKFSTLSNYDIWAYGNLIVDIEIVVCDAGALSALETESL